MRIAEEIPIPVSIQILTPSLVFQGGLPPVFRRIFALCPAFQRQVGYLPYPREKSGTQGRQRLLLLFHRSGWYVFCKCISSYKPGFPKCRNDFSILLSVLQQRQKSYLQHLRSYYETAAVIRKIKVSQQVFRFCNTCNTSADTRHCPGFSQSYPCITTPRGHCSRCQYERALCSALDRDRSDFPLPMPAAGLCT